MARRFNKDAIMSLGSAVIAAMNSLKTIRQAYYEVEAQNQQRLQQTIITLSNCKCTVARSAATFFFNVRSKEHVSKAVKLLMLNRECDALGLNDFPTAERLQCHGYVPETAHWSETSRFAAFTLVHFKWGSSIQTLLMKLKKLSRALKLGHRIVLESLQAISAEERKGRKHDHSCYEISYFRNVRDRYMMDNLGKTFQRTLQDENVVAGNGWRNWAHSTRMSTTKASSGFRLLQRQDAADDCYENGAVMDESSCCFCRELFTNFDEGCG
ncbi:hypothetical protein Tco_0461038 [Tanacetum coccineum]